MKSRVALRLLHHLVDVPIEHRERSEPFHQAERTRPVLRSPTPLRIHLPEGHVRKYYQRCAVGNGFQVILDPGQLLSAEHAQSAFTDLQNVIEADEVCAFVIEAVPAAPFCADAET